VPFCLAEILNNVKYSQTDKGENAAGECLEGFHDNDNGTALTIRNCLDTDGNGEWADTSNACIERECHEAIEWNAHWPATLQTDRSTGSCIEGFKSNGTNPLTRNCKTDGTFDVLLTGSC
jgi:hypothetical protein